MARNSKADHDRKQPDNAGRARPEAGTAPDRAEGSSPAPSPSHLARKRKKQPFGHN